MSKNDNDLPLPSRKQFRDSNHLRLESDKGRGRIPHRIDIMKDEYDLSKMKSRLNSYAKQLKKQVTLRVNPDVIDYFKEIAEETGMPY